MQKMNQFQQKAELGDLDLAFNHNTMAAVVDDTISGDNLEVAQAVKIVDEAGGPPKIKEISSDTDEVWGFISRDLKKSKYEKGDACEVASQNNVIYLEANGAITRGAQVTVDSATTGHVKEAVDGKKIVGYALDKADDGELLRVYLKTPSFETY